jgi:hypothetical protein
VHGRTSLNPIFSLPESKDYRQWVEPHSAPNASKTFPVWPWAGPAVPDATKTIPPATIGPADPSESSPKSCTDQGSLPLSMSRAKRNPWF